MFEQYYSEYLIIFSLIFGSILCQNNYAYDSTGIDFPGLVNFRRHENSSINSEMSLEMEIQLAQEYNRIDKIEDFISRIHGLPRDLYSTDISTRIKDEDGGRANVEIAKEAGCIPEMQAVSVRNSSGSFTATYIPNCIRVPRCGGCCRHPSLSCQATDTVEKNFPIIVTEFIMNEGLYYKEKQIVTIKEHTKCSCKCRIQPEDCNEKQVYLSKQCRCDCTNVDDRTKCLRSNDTKRWDENSCSCHCRGSTECTSGSYYDTNTCSCKRIAMSHRRHVGQDRKPYDSGLQGFVGRQRPVYTISADDPRRKPKEDPEE